MDINNKKFVVSSALLLSALNLFNSQPVFAAFAMKLAHRPVAILQVFTPGLSSAQQADKKLIELKESSRDLDFNQTLHVRIEEKYNGYPVMGANGIIHIPHAGKSKQTLNEIIAAADKNGSINGMLYQNLDTDLADGLSKVRSGEQQKKAVEKIRIEWRAQNNSHGLFLDEESKEMVIYVDKAQKAHWAYKINFLLESANKLLARPVYIVDAMTLTNYAQWDSNIAMMRSDNVDRISKPDFANNKISFSQQSNNEPAVEEVKVGGYGGNKRSGKIIYDGFYYPQLTMLRDASSGTCYLSNSTVIVKDDYTRKRVETSCPKSDPYHPNIYWNGSFDAVNGGYSPANDALYAGTVITQMFQKWYGISALQEPDGQPMKVMIYVHANTDYDLDESLLLVGDGNGSSHPFTSLPVIAFLFGFDYTSQHSNLPFYDRSESAAIAFAFSAMTAQAVNYFAYHKTDWQVGAEISKDGKAMHYLDQPSKDCNGKNPGQYCHIDSANQYYKYLWQGYACGPYEHAFYLLATIPGWNIKKAYDVMLKANQHYWVRDINFTDGACGVINAAKDYGYDTAAVSKAFDAVDIDTSDC